MPERYLVALLLAAVTLCGQVSTRAGEIEAARETKSARLTPEKNSRIEQALLYIKLIFDSLPAGSPRSPLIRLGAVSASAKS